MPVPAADEARHPPHDGDREQRALERVVTEEPPQIIPAEDDPARDAADGDLRDAEGRAPLEHLEPDDASHRDSALEELGAEIGQRHLQPPPLVGRRRGKLDAHRPQGGHVGGGEDGAGVFRVTAAVGVVEGREEVPLPE